MFHRSRRSDLFSSIFVFLLQCVCHQQDREVLFYRAGTEARGSIPKIEATDKACAIASEGTACLPACLLKTIIFRLIIATATMMMAATHVVTFQNG